MKLVLRKTSLVDFPGLISAVLFFPGCNLRCPWCHNRELVNGEVNSAAEYVSTDEALIFLSKRRFIVRGVVLSGGEPTLFAGLEKVIHEIKLLELKVKIDTNGLLPHVLETLINSEKSRPDYIAMDLKTDPRRYAELLPADFFPAEAISGNYHKNTNPGEAIKRSAELIRSSGIAHEFRSLLLPHPQGTEPFFNESIKKTLAALAGDSPWHIRPFVPGNCLDPKWNQFPQINAP